MPKGFNAKAIRGFTQWMGATLQKRSLSAADADALVSETRVLLEEGFPQARNY